MRSEVRQPEVIYGDDVLAQAGGVGDVSHLLYDGHGSTRQVIDNALAVASRYSYDAYGVRQENSYNTSGTSLRYCGEQYDADLQMYNLRARYYNPNNGRFNQRDTFAGSNFDPQSLHKYAYCHGDPVNLDDPSGQWVMIALLVAIVVVAILTYAIVNAVGTSIAGYHADAGNMAGDPYKSWIDLEAKAAGIEPRFLAAILATEILDRDAKYGFEDTYGDIWGSLLGNSSVGLGQVTPETAQKVLHYGRLRSSLALWNRKTNIHVAAQWIKTLIEMAKDYDNNNPNFRFYFDGTPNMSLGQYKSPMSSWDDAHKKLLAQQYTQLPWEFEPNAKYGYQPRLASKAISYYGSFWENYTSSEFKSAFP
jgi:RHS repeat-associated protein